LQFFASLHLEKNHGYPESDKLVRGSLITGEDLDLSVSSIRAAAIVTYHSINADNQERDRVRVE
jgi:hypothetical protein